VNIVTGLTKSCFAGTYQDRGNPPSPPLGLRRHPHTAKASPNFSFQKFGKKIKIMEKSESLKKKGKGTEKINREKK
jgi:hypothetical protein